MRMLGSVAIPKSLELFWMKNNSDWDRISSSSGTRTRTRKRSLQQKQLRAIIRFSHIRIDSDSLSLRYIHSALVPGRAVSFGTKSMRFFAIWWHGEAGSWRPYDEAHVGSLTKILLVELESSLRWDPLGSVACFVSFCDDRRDYTSIWCSWWERTEAWCVLRAKALGSVLPWMCALYIDKQHLWIPNTGSARICC